MTGGQTPPSDDVPTNSDRENNIDDEYRTKYEELKLQFEASQVKIESLNNKISEMETTIRNLALTNDSQKASLEKYEGAEKERIIDKFSKCLPADVMQEIVDEKANLTIDELSTRCAVAYTTFSMAKENGEEVRIPQPKAQEDEPALFAILKKYKRQ